jgi:hypothetical protein
MVRPITEDQARAALLAAYSEAHDARYFRATRQTGGWLFRWDPQAGEIRMGTSPWVVADNGQVREVRFREEAADLLAELNGPSRPE